MSRKYDALSRTLQGTYVNHVLQLSDTRLVVATQTSGLFLYDLQEGVLERITKETYGVQRLFAFLPGFFRQFVGGHAKWDRTHTYSFSDALPEPGDQPAGSGYEAFETVGGTYFTTSNGIYFLEKNAAQSTFLTGTEVRLTACRKLPGNCMRGITPVYSFWKILGTKRLANTDVYGK